MCSFSSPTPQAQAPAVTPAPAPQIAAATGAPGAPLAPTPPVPGAARRQQNVAAFGNPDGPSTRRPDTDDSLNGPTAGHSGLNM